MQVLPVSRLVLVVSDYVSVGWVADYLSSGCVTILLVIVRLTVLLYQ